MTIAAWVLAMIAVPIQRWIGGEGIMPSAITLGVVLQVIASWITLARAPSWGIRWSLLLIALVVPAAWLVEFIGSSTGFPFGVYHYTPLLQPQVGGVPLLIPFAWLMMLPPSWAVGRILTRHIDGRRGIFAFIAVSVFAFTAWDLFLDPQMVKWTLWAWGDPGSFHYFGIPWINFVGWLFAAAAITALVMWVFAALKRDMRDLPIIPLLIVYAITWALQSIGQWFFWGLPGSGSVGFVVMGVCLVAAVRRLLAESSTKAV